MPIFTPNYELASFVPGETIDPLEDSRRFLVIDRQLLGLFEVLGNGVISGWEVQASGGLTASISPGSGNVSFLSGFTTESGSVTLVPGTVNYIYAAANVNTRFDRSVTFSASTVLFTGGPQILLAAVTTSDTTIVSIDTSGRQDISFIAEIKALINQHRHRGPPGNPTKIDLTQEVMGQLPGFHIDNIDASKVTTGIIDPARFPLFEHSDLLHSGVLTHAQLDSFVRNLSNPNVRLLGELGAVNMMQLWLALKHIWNDTDAFTTNLIVEIPGITPDSFTDFLNTTAVVDKVNHTISGVPALNGQLVTTTFRTDADFSAATLKSNIAIGRDLTGDFFTITKPFSSQIVDSFDNVFATAEPLPGWTVETVASADDTTFLSDSTEKVDGPFSAKFTIDQSMRVQTTKIFSTSQNWTSFNEIQLFVETLTPAHGKIIFQTLTLNPNGVLQELDSFTILNVNETTVGFRKIVRDITNVVRTKVDAIRLYTDSSLGWDLSKVVFNVDSIELNNNLFFSPSGRIRFRLTTPQKSHWAAISWTGDTNGGIIQARARTAPFYATFDQSTSSVFGSFSSISGDDPHVDDNRAIEIELALTPNSGRTSAPKIRSVTISYITNSTQNGIVVDTTDQFDRATLLSNAAVVDPGSVIIKGRIDVGDVVYGLQHSVQQASLSNVSGVTVFATPVVGIDGTALPLSPLQAVNVNFGLKQSSIDGAASVERLQDRSYLVADTLNDRIIQFERNGKPRKILATNNVRNVKDLYPISTAYNTTNSTLYIAWSTNVSLNSLDLSKMTISGTGISITLSNTTDTVVRLAGVNNETVSANVSPIILSSAHAGELTTFFGDSTVSDQRIFLQISPDAAKEGINANNLNFATLVGPRGMPIFVGDLKFITNLYRPISVTRTLKGNWLVCNAKPLLTTTGGADPITGISAKELNSTIEIDPISGDVVFSDNSVDYSLITLGSAIELDNPILGIPGSNIAVAGIVVGTGAPTTFTSNSVTATVGGGVVQTVNTVSTTAAQAATATTTAGNTTSTTTTSTDLDVLTNRVGIVKIVEKASGRVIFQQQTSDGTYAADVQIDAEGNLVTIEKSFSNGGNGIANGRVIKLDEDGNVFFQFGMADLASPNDVRVLSTGNLIVSA